MYIRVRAVYNNKLFESTQAQQRPHCRAMHLGAAYSAETET